MLTYILLNLVGLLKEMDNKQCDLHTFNLKCKIVKKIFSQFFARICIFSSKFYPRNTDHRLEIIIFNKDLSIQAS